MAPADLPRDPWAAWHRNAPVQAKEDRRLTVISVLMEATARVGSRHVVAATAATLFRLATADTPEAAGPSGICGVSP